MIDIIMTAVGNLLYPLFSVIFVFIDLLQIIFYAFAGIGDVYVGGVTNLGFGATHVKGDEGGLLYYFLQTDLVKNLFISIMVLALVLIVIFTILAFLKNIYAAKPKKWQDIIGDAIKGLGMFLVIPVLCLLGVWVGNILLRAINSATNTTSSYRISAMLFKSTAYNANRIRLDDDFTMEDLEYYRNTFVKITALEDEVYDEYNNLNKEYYANAIDDWYIANWGILINPLSAALIAPGYNLANMNYLIMVGGGVFILYSLCAISFGMIKRLFTLLVLYVISPAICALYPIKGEGPVKSWTGDFVKNTISAYGYVAGLNIMFALLPLFQRIQIPGAYDILGIIPLLITIAGLYMVKDVIALISGYIGASNAYADGASLMNTVKGRVGWAGKKVKGITGAFAKAKGAHDAGGSFFGSLARSTGKATMDTLSGVVGLPTTKEFKDSIGAQIKAGKSEAKQAAEIKNFEQLQKDYKNATDADTKKEIFDKLMKSATTLGIQDEGKEKLAKKLGVSKDQVQASLDASNSVEDARKAYSKQIAKSNKLNQTIDDLSSTDAATFTAAKNQINSDFGVDLKDAADAMGLSVTTLGSMFKDGIKMDFDEKALRDKGLSDDAINNYRIQSQKYNSAVDERMSVKKETEDKAKAFAESYISASGKVLDSNGFPVKLDDSAKEEIRKAMDTAIKSGNPADFMSSLSTDIQKTLAMLQGQGKTQADSVKEALAKLDDVAKVVKSKDKK